MTPFLRFQLSGKAVLTSSMRATRLQLAVATITVRKLKAIVIANAACRYIEVQAATFIKATSNQDTDA